MSEQAPAASSLRQVLGAMIFSSERAVSAQDLLKNLRLVASGREDDVASLFAGVEMPDVLAAIEDLRRDLLRMEAGFELIETAGGFRFRSQAACGTWVRQLLQKPPPNHLSPPAIETLAIVAYRQPVSRADIEAIRGVASGHILRSLIELRLVRIAGRSDLPGKPFLYGTSATFLEHFGLKKLSDLADIDPSLFKRKKTKSGRKNGDG